MKHCRLLQYIAGVTALGTVISIPIVAVAQTNLLSPGSRVRVTAPDYDLRGMTGLVLRLTIDSITIERDDALPDLTLPFHRVERLQVSTGKRPGLGLAQGAAVGIGIGTLAGLAFGGLQYLTSSKEERELWFLIAVPLGAGAGLIIGSIVGAAQPPDNWQDLSLPGHSRPPGLGRLGSTTRIGFSISF
jgi:hypothetical protein